MTSSIGVHLHEIYSPSGQRPFLIIKVQQRSSLNKERDEDLDSADQKLDCGVTQFTIPDFKVPSFACVFLQNLSWRLEVFGGL